MLLYVNHREAYSKTSCNLHHLHNFLLSLFQHRFLPGMLQDASGIFKRDHFVRCSKSLHKSYHLLYGSWAHARCTQLASAAARWPSQIVTRFGPAKCSGSVRFCASYDHRMTAACFSASPIFSKPTCSRFPKTNLTATSGNCPAL